MVREASRSQPDEEAKAEAKFVDMLAPYLADAGLHAENGEGLPKPRRTSKAARKLSRQPAPKIVIAICS
jgi:hypothetical protein